MSRAFPESTGEVEVELRDAARRAARRDGLSIREWLDAAVDQHAATLGMPAADLGADERLNAVSQRLRELASDRAAGTRPLPPPVARTRADERVREASTRRDLLDVMRSPSSGASPEPSAETRSRRVDKGGDMNKMSRDLQPDRLAGERPRLVGAAASRAVEFAMRPAAPDDAETVVDQSGSEKAPLAARHAWRRDAAPRFVPAPKPTTAVIEEDDPNDLGKVEAKLTALFRALDRKPALSTADRDEVSRQPWRSEPLVEAEAALQTPPPAVHRPAVAPTRSLAQAIAEIAERQAVLDRVPASALPPAQIGPAASLSDPEPAPHQAARAAAANLLEQFGSSRLKPPAVRSRPLGRPAPQPAPPPVVSPQADAVDAAAAFERVRNQTDVGREVLTTGAVPNPQIKRVEQQIADIDARVDELVNVPQQAATTDPVVLAELRVILETLRAGKGLEALEQRIEVLSVKIDTLIAGQVQPAVIDQLSQKIGTIHSSLEAHLALPPAPAVDLAPMEAMINGLIGRFDSMRQNAGDLRTLEDMVHRLATNLEDARDPHAGAEVLVELQTQVGKLAERIDRSDAGLTAIVSMERSLGELFAQLEETREAAINAAEGAARTAARDTLRAAMLDPGLSGRRGADAADNTVEHVTRELLEFRTARESADRRLNAMMSTVNQTLEQVVARLVALEDGSAKANQRVASPARSGTSVTVESVATAGEIEPQLEAALVDRAATAAEARTAGPVDRSRPVFDLGEADFPIEPGTVPVRPRAPAKAGATAPDVKADPTQFIAAARRAAQAAAQDSANRSSAAAATRARGGKASVVEPAASSAGRVKAYAVANRRPLLLSLAALVLLLGVAEVAQRTRAAPDALLANDTAATAPKAEADQVAATPKPVPPAADASRDAATAQNAAPPLADGTGAIAVAPNPVRTLPTMAMGQPAARAAIRLANADPSGGIGDGLRDLAQDGNAAAQYEVGLRFADGRGVTRDLKAAAGWFEKAAKQGLAPAAYRLGSLYEKGLGVTRDPAQAVDLYQKAADAGNVRAMHNLAVMSAEGVGGKSDYARAAQWFAKASQMGVRDSQFNLAILYARGLGIEQSMPQSYTWFAIAAAQGDMDAAKKRDEVGARLDPKALAAAKAAADDFKPITPLQAANEVKPPPGGWDAVAPTHAPTLPNTAGKSSSNARVSSL